MKNRIFTFGVMALLFAACSINELEIATPDAIDAEEFFATIEDASTRVFVDDDLMVLWHADDRVSIFNKYTYNQEYRFTGQTGANSGSFTKVPNDDFVTGNTLNYVYAVYPYQESSEISNQGVLSIDLPATQFYAENSFGIGANTMVSCSQGNELLFKNLCGYIMLKLYGDNVAVKSISIKGNNDEPLAGRATVNASVGNAPSMAFDASATKEITLTFETPVTIGTTAETATSFWLVIPPTSFSKGITLTVKSGKNGEFKKSTTAGLQVNRNTLKRMSALSVDITEKQPDNEIWYTSTNGTIVSPNNRYGFGATLLTNEYLDGKGILTFDGAISSLGNNAFYNCSSLESISLPQSVTSIKLNAFLRCSSLSSISLPENVTTIGESAFGSCSSLQSVNIPNKVTSIGDYAFSGCIVLPAMFIPKNVTSIGSGCFSGCSGLSSIVVDSLNPFFDSRNNCNAIIKTNSNELLFGCKNTIIPTSVTSIGENAFNANKGLTSIDVPNSVTIIGANAFTYSGLESVTLPESVTTIGKSAFYFCSNLLTVILPKSVVSIGDYAFDDCNSLTSVIVKALTPPTGGIRMFWTTNNCPIFVPAESLNIYKTAQYWSDYSERLQAIIIPQAVNLGLSVKWASFDVGATKPENKGVRYMWGDIAPANIIPNPTNWYWDQYKWVNVDSNYNLRILKYNTLSRYGNVDNVVQLENEDDAASFEYGVHWRIPTLNEWNELQTNCTITKDVVNGVIGFRFSAINGNSIFLPQTNDDSDDPFICYWTSNVCESDPLSAWAACVFYTGSNQKVVIVNNQALSRCYDYPIRPVYVE